MNQPMPSPSENAAVPVAPEDAPLTASGWLAQNGVLMLIVVAVVGYLFSRVGVEGLLPLVLAAVGLGFLIFIHELGHFLAAKWCDVHVKTFSIGFGPAVPGCQFTVGETTYMIGILPLGGYVNMVGEGTEGDEEESNPRSFKAKTVFQRMLIISAGVIMNLLFGLLCFVVIFRLDGIEETVAAVWRTEPGSPAWKSGVRVGWSISEIDHRKDPSFEELKLAVANSGHNAILRFKFTDRENQSRDIALTPIRGTNLVPTIGVVFPKRLELQSARAKRNRALPVLYNSAAASARELSLEPGDTIVKIDDEPAGDKPFDKLGLTLLNTDPAKQVQLQVRRKDGKEEKLTLAPGGFSFHDRIVGMSDPTKPNEPFHVTALKPAPPQKDRGTMGDSFEFRERMMGFFGRPVVIEVQRGKDNKAVRLFVPPAFTRDLGMRMKMGQVDAVRLGSEAEKSGLEAGEVISRVGVKYLDGPVDWQTFKDFDPVRLPEALYQLVHAQPDRKPNDYRVVFKVWATIDHKQGMEREKAPIPWDDSWALDEDAPQSPTSPMAIPQLGIAYRVESTIVDIKKDSPAAKAGLRTGDEIVQLRIREADKTLEGVKWSSWADLSSKRDRQGQLYDQWAHYHYALQGNDFAIVEVKIKRGGDLLKEVFSLDPAVLDPTWPSVERGFIFLTETRKEEVTSLVQAMGLGINRSVEFIQNILLSLKNILTNRISVESIGGPKMIAEQAFTVANEDWFIFLQFLAIISINLAVVNFLPIPVLDGGHMVFLIYEWIRGKPPSDAVKNIATYIGVAFLLSLMVFVFYLDFTRKTQ
jgi:regulator of sigma E protease